MEEYVAWTVLAVFGIFGGIPSFGSLFSPNISNYKDDFKVGVCIVCAIAAISGSIALLTWAFIKVVS